MCCDKTVAGSVALIITMVPVPQPRRIICRACSSLRDRLDTSTPTGPSS